MRCFNLSGQIRVARNHSEFGVMLQWQEYRSTVTSHFTELYISVRQVARLIGNQFPSNSIDSLTIIRANGASGVGSLAFEFGAAAVLD